MKLRTDFITNSSSSSFVLARKGEELTEKQKEIILDYVENVMLGTLVSLPKNYTAEEMEELFRKNHLYLPRDDYQSLVEAVNDGDEISVGEVYFEDETEVICDLYQGLWRSLDGVDGFKIIDGDLNY